MKRLVFIIASLLLIIVSFSPSDAKERGIEVKFHQNELPGSPIIGDTEMYKNSYALVIGINNYTQGWPRLSEAVHDAELVADTLRKKGSRLFKNKP